MKWTKNENSLFQSILEEHKTLTKRVSFFILAMSYNLKELKFNNQ